MSKFLIYATYAQRNNDDEDLGLNQWLVGERNTLKECYDLGKEHITESTRQDCEDMYEGDEINIRFEDIMSELQTFEYKPQDFSLDPITIYEIDYTYPNGYMREKFDIWVIRLS